MQDEHGVRLRARATGPGDEHGKRVSPTQFIPRDRSNRRCSQSIQKICYNSKRAKPVENVVPVHAVRHYRNVGVVYDILE